MLPIGESAVGYVGAPELPFCAMTLADGLQGCDGGETYRVCAGNVDHRTISKSGRKVANGGRLIWAGREDLEHWPSAYKS